MAVITTAGSGNWSSTTPNAPWSGGTLPVPGTDTVVVANGHTLTLNDDRTVGTSGATGTAAITVNATGTLVIAGATLTAKGDVVTTNAASFRTGLSLVTSGGVPGGIEFDPPAGSSYRLVPAQSVNVVVTGTSAARCFVRTKARHRQRGPGVD